MKLAVMRIHNNLGHPSKEVLCRALRIGGANRVVLRSANDLKCDVCFKKDKPPRSHLPAKLRDSYTEFNQGNAPVFEFLNMVDLATRIIICFPVPSKRLDDVLSVLDLVWINWARTIGLLISDILKVNLASSRMHTVFDSVSRRLELRGNTDLSNGTVAFGEELPEKE